MRKITYLFIGVLLAILIQTVFPGTVQAIYKVVAGTGTPRTFKDEKPAKKKSVDPNRPGYPHVNFDDPRPAIADSARVAGGPAIAGASADFDSDGVPDLVTVDTGGKLKLFKGNVDTIYPNSADAKMRREQTGDPSPLITTGSEYDLPFSPDLVAAGDFNADGASDILAAATGADSIYLLAGNGKGGFAAARAIAVGGSITSIATGEIGRIDGQIDVAIGIRNQKGAFLLVYENPEGAFRHDPEKFTLPSPATDIAIGQLDSDPYADIAVACGNDITVVHGRGQAYPLDLKADLNIQRPAATVQTRHLPFRAAAIVIGNFGPERGDSLAILSNDGSVRLLKRPAEVVSQRRLTSADMRNAAATAFAPTGVDARRFTRIKRDQILDEKQAEQNGLLMMDPEDGKMDLSAYAAEKARLDNEKFEKLPSAERSRILSEKAANAIETRQRRKEAFEQNLAGQPADLTKFDLKTIAADGRLANAAAGFGSKTLISARVSDSGHDDLIVPDPVSKQIHIIYQADATGSAKTQRQTAEILSLTSETTPTALIPIRLNSDALSDLVILGQGSAVPMVMETVPGQVFVVDTTDNDSSGNCDGSEPCALRRAIFMANLTPGPDEIDFNIPGGGVQTIHPLSALPDVTEPVSD